MFTYAYQILEIPHIADQEMIREAYRNCVWELHPDVCLLPDASQRFCRVRDAHAELKSAGAGSGMESLSSRWNDYDYLSGVLERSGDTIERVCALRRLVNGKRLFALPQVFQAFQSEQPRLRWAAIHAFGRLGVRSSYPHLAEAFSYCTRDQKWAIMRFLPQLSSGREDDLLRLIVKDSDPLIRAWGTQYAKRHQPKETAHAFG